MMVFSFLIFHPLLNALNLYSPNYFEVTLWKPIGISTADIKMSYITLKLEVKYSSVGKINLTFSSLLKQTL